MAFNGWRYIFAVIATQGIILVYMLRVNLSVALISMVNSTVFKAKNATPECPVYTNETVNDKTDGVLLWSEEEQGLLLASFYWGYCIMQIPCGILTMYLNAKWVYGISTFLTVVFTALTPTVADLGLYQSMALRFAMGVFEGPTYPVLYNLCGRWVLESERSIIMSTISTGASIGTVIGQSISGVIADKLGWRWIFYIMTAIGCVWFGLFVLLTSNSPKTHMFINVKERKLLTEKILANHEGYKPQIKKVPWFKVFTSKPTLALLAVNVTYNFTWYTMINCLPYYVGQVLGFNISANGILSSIPYIVCIVTSFLGGFVFDAINQKHLISKTKLRKSFICLGLLLAAIMQLCIIFTGCNVNAALTLVCLTLGMMGITNSSTAPNYIDLAPGFSGSILSVINVCGTISGIIAPYIKGFCTRTGETRANWANVFMTSSALLLFGSVIYLMFGSGSIQPWAMGDIKAEELVNFDDDDDDDDDDDNNNNNDDKPTESFRRNYNSIQ